MATRIAEAALADAVRTHRRLHRCREPVVLAYALAPPGDDGARRLERPVVQPFRTAEQAQARVDDICLVSREPRLFVIYDRRARAWRAQANFA